ncbi:MAG TPA: PAS domain S-box protein, partial [Anaerolineae bacterium]|nr:PAS domain S-box protein [Anaerolineae bacterium]
MEDDHPVRILFVEDVPADAELAARALRKEGLAFTSTRVETKAALLKALEEFKPDVIVSDYALPEFDGMQALKLSLERDAAVPFILFTGSLNEETAVACMKAGASDYVLKDRLRQLPFAVKEVLERKQTRLAQAEAERALRESESRYRELFEAESDAIVLIDNATGNILEANSAAVALYGYDHAELLTKRNVDLSAEPEETQQVTQGTPIIPDQVVTIQLRFHRKKDGSVFPAEITGRFFIRDGRPVHIAAIRDITERKRAEQE